MCTTVATLINVVTTDIFSDKKSRAKNISRNEAPLPRRAAMVTSDKSECVPILLTYNPALRSDEKGSAFRDIG